MTDVALTPEDVASKRFTPVRGGGEGYNMEEVDTFLDHVEASLNAYTLHITQISDEMARLAPFEEQAAAHAEAAEQARADADHAQAELSRAEIRNRDLEARSEELQRQLESMRGELNSAHEASNSAPAYVEPVAAPVAEPFRVGSIADASVAAAKLLEHATVSAEAIKEEAETETREKLAAAEAEARAVREEAEAQAEELRHASETEAASVREAAQAEAEAQAAELAAVRASTLEELENERGVLSARVEELRDFEGTVRTDLTAYLADLQSRVAAPLPSSDVEAPVEDEVHDDEAADAGFPSFLEQDSDAVVVDEPAEDELVEVIEEGAANERFEEEIHDIVEDDSETDANENGVPDADEVTDADEVPADEDDADSEKPNED